MSFFPEASLTHLAVTNYLPELELHVWVCICLLLSISCYILYDFGYVNFCTNKTSLPKNKHDINEMFGSLMGSLNKAIQTPNTATTSSTVVPDLHENAWKMEFTVHNGYCRINTSFNIEQARPYLCGLKNTTEKNDNIVNTIRSMLQSLLTLHLACANNEDGHYGCRASKVRTVESNKPKSDSSFSSAICDFIADSDEEVDMDALLISTTDRIDEPIELESSSILTNKSRSRVVLDNADKDIIRGFTRGMKDILSSMQPQNESSGFNDADPPDDIDKVRMCSSMEKIIGNIQTGDGDFGEMFSGIMTQMQSMI